MFNKNPTLEPNKKHTGRNISLVCVEVLIFSTDLKFSNV